MTDEDQPDEVKKLAEKLIADKREDAGGEEQARELYDVPSESAAGLAEDQRRREEE